MIPVTKIDLKDKDGTVLNTEKKYCRQNILVLPRLNPLEVTENGTYPVPQGFAGNGQVKVSVNPKKETALVVTGNGTYVAPSGTVYTSVVVNVPTEGGGDSTHVHKYTVEVTDPSCTMGGYTTYICECGHSYIAYRTDPLGHSYVDGVCEICGAKAPAVEPDEPEVDTGSYAVIVGDVFGIPYHGSSPTVECPNCLTYYDDGGVLMFTAEAVGSGVIRLTRHDSLIGEYTVTVASVEVYDYDLKIGEEFSVVYDGSSPSVECPSCLTYYDDGGEFVFTAAIVGTGTLRLYRSDSLIASYTIRVSEKNVGSDTHVHSFTHSVTPPTCTEGGYTTHTCTICEFSYRDTPVAARHTPGEPVRVREATCCIPPEYVVSCTRCGQEIYRYEDDGEFAEHIADGGRITTPATCIKTGIKTYRCRECDTWIREEIVPATGVHTYSDVVTPPTCTEGGYTTRTCTVCGHSYNYEDTDPTGHNFMGGWYVAIAAECESQGLEKRVCLNDGCNHEETRAIPATGHKWGEPYESSAFSSGYGQRCTVCGELNELTMPQCQHSEYTAQVTLQPTCIHDGATTFTCSKCGHKWTEPITATGIHDYVAVVTPATCTKGGYTTHTCSRCKDTYVSDETDPNGHNFAGGWVVTKAATCTESGTEKRTCLTCGHFETRTVVATGHKYKTTVTAPTCTAKGYTTHTCTVCGHSYTDSEKAALGHSRGTPVRIREATCTVPAQYAVYCTRCGVEVDRYEDDGEFADHIADGGRVTTAATCVTTGIRKYYCRECDTWIRDEKIPATGIHSYTDSVTLPTCTEYGYTTHTCTVCGHSYTDEETDPNGHNFVGGWQTDEAPTCTSGGSEKRICLTCGHTEYRDVDSTGHDWGFAYTVAADCESGGYDVYECSNCGETYTANETDPNGHNFVGGWTTDEEPTCTSSGTESRTCLNCGATESRSIDPLGHDWVEYPDPSASSGVSRYCTRCEDVEEDV